MDGLVPLIVMVRTIFFRSGEYGVVLDWPRAFNSWLVLHGVEDFIKGEPQGSVVYFPLEGLE